MNHPPPHAPPRSATPRVLAVSGGAQSGHAFATSTGPGYETLYARPLVVRILGARSGTVRFTCVQSACRFAVSDQPEEVRRVDTRTYDVDAKDGRAELTLTLGTDTVPGDYTVIARPLVKKRVVAGTTARFALSVR